MAIATVNIIPAATTYDEITSISGPASALPGATLTYTVQTQNIGTGNTTSAVQRVTLPAGVTATNITGGGTQAGNTITFPAVTNQVPGSGAAVVNTFNVTMPTTGSLAITANVTATGESNTGNNNASVTTTAANQAPLAANIVNKLQAPQGNTAGALPLSSLAGSDADGTVSSYTITTLPDATRGVLQLNGSPVTINQTIAPGDIAKLTFDPAGTFVGNAFFNYTATDNLGAVSVPALYTIQVGQDNNSVYANTPTKGVGNGSYQNNDVLAFVTDINAARFSSAGLVYNATTGALVNGTVLNGVASASITQAEITRLAGFGIALNTVTGQFFVQDRTKLVAGTYTTSVTTIDLNGGTNTQNVTFPIGNNPLPVTLVSFGAQAAGLNARLNWKTAQELNNDHFVVERSFDARSFVEVGQVKGQGSTQSATTYDYTDVRVAAQTPAGLVYYRLRQVDTDGTESLSEVQTVRFPLAARTLIDVYPSPATAAQDAKLDLSGAPAGSYQVTLVDMTGRTLRTFRQNGGTVQELQLTSLPNGTYLVQVKGNGQSFNRRVIKQ